MNAMLMDARVTKAIATLRPDLERSVDCFSWGQKHRSPFRFNTSDPTAVGLANACALRSGRIDCMY